MDAARATFLLDLAEGSNLRVEETNPELRLREVERRSGELDAALDWFVARDDADGALRLVNALYRFWDDRQRLEDGWAACMRALGVPGGDPTIRASAWINAGFLALWSGHDDRSPKAFDQGLAMSRELGNRALEARSLGGLARVALRSDVARGRLIARELLALGDATGDRSARSDALHLLGVAAQISGDLVEARTWMRERLELVREEGDAGATAVEAGNLGTVERQLGNLDAAEGLIREALQLAERRGDEFVKPFAISGLAAVATDRGDVVRAARLLGATEAMMEASGISWPADERPQYDQMLERLPDRMGRTDFEAERAAGRSMPAAEAVRFALDAGGNGSAT